ncbi:MAG TPA: DUF2142 domain-containing protein [Pantanalinema sp.]
MHASRLLPTRRLNTATILALVLALVLLKQIAWLVVIPIWQTPDEPAHFHHVQYLGETGRLPVFDAHKPLTGDSEEVGHTAAQTGLNWVAYRPDHKVPVTDGPDGPLESRLREQPPLARTNDGNSSAANYPPGYYYPASLVYRAFWNGTVVDRVFAVRALSSLFILVTAAAAFFLSGALWPSRFVRACFALLVGFQPMLSMAGVSVNNDAILIALASLTAWTLAVQWQRGLSLGRGALLGLLVGLGMLSKPQMIVFLGLVPAAALAQALWRKEGALAWLRAMAAFGLVFAACYAPWLWHCRQTYGMWMPSLLGAIPVMDVPLHSYVWHYMVKPGLTRTHDLWVVGFWANFGWLDTMVFDPAYRLVELFMWIGALGTWRWLRRRQTGWQVMLVAVAAAAGFLAFLYMAEYQVFRPTGTPMLQGRYWLPVLLPLMLIGFGGVLNLSPVGKQRVTAGVIAIVALLFNALCLLRLIERYYV